MTEIRNVKSGKTAKVSLHLAATLVKGGKFEYATREMRPESRLVPMVQPTMTPASEPDVEISPRTGKPKRQYKRRAIGSSEEE